MRMLRHIRKMVSQAHNRCGMKIFWIFVFILLFGQEISAEEPSFYEEFDPRSALEEESRAEHAKQPAAENNAEQSPADFQEDFFLTDEKHAHFTADNEQYALADSMLNQTWRILVRKSDKKAYGKLWQGHKIWLESGRNDVANTFKEQVPVIPEDHAFMLATVAKTQELAQKIWHEPVLGRYVKGETFVTLTEEDEKIFLQGYGTVPLFMGKSAEADVSDEKDAAQRGAGAKPQESAVSNAKLEQEKTLAEKNAVNAENRKNEPLANTKTMPQLFFRAELPEDGKLWLALSTVNGQKLYLLSMQDSLCIVHAPALFPLDFNGVFARK